MKKLIYAICMGAAVAFSSCEDMLDTTNYTEKTTATFPESYDDAQQMIAGVYASMASVCANPERSFLYYAQIETLDNCPDFPSTEARNQLMGEALFMRAYFYYELASMYNRVPGKGGQPQCGEERLLPV